MNTDFQKWHKRKQELHESKFRANFGEREVWWCSLGLNVGFEEDGKTDRFERPVLILRKFSKELFVGVPLSTKIKRGIFYHDIKVGDRSGVVILSQARALSVNRLLRRVGRIGEDELQSILDCHAQLLKKSDSRKESSGANGDLLSNSTNRKRKSQEETE